MLCECEGVKVCMVLLYISCMHTCNQLPSNQTFDRQIPAHEKGGCVRRVGQWVWTGNCLQVCYMTIIEVHLTMHLVEPN